MKLEDYFHFLTPDDIRFRGNRIGIESVLYEYVHRLQSPEAIHLSYPSPTLEQVCAAILYSLHNKPRMEAYLADWLEFGRQAREEQKRNLPPAVVRLQELKKEIAASGLTVEQYLKQRKATREVQDEQLVAA